MTTMSEAERVWTWTGLISQMRREVDVGDPAVRNEILAAVEATDDWVDANQSSYNTALPAAFKTWATPRQKALLLAMVLMRRHDSNVDEA
jgi:hypothetical protein